LLVLADGAFALPLLWRESGASAPDRAARTTRPEPRAPWARTQPTT